MKSTIAIVGLIAVAGTANAQAILTGILDGDLSGGQPKALEIYVNGTVDFTGWTIERSSNGNAFGTSSNLDSLGVVTDSFVYLVDLTAPFVSLFGTSGDFANTFEIGNISHNGDDAYRILNSGASVVDQVWLEDTNNSYQDSWIYRNDFTGPDGGWVPSNWTFGGNGLLDGLDAAGQAAATPFGTYVIPAPGAMALAGLAGVVGIRRRRA
jgi:uncharacterized protein